MHSEFCWTNDLEMMQYNKTIKNWRQKYLVLFNDLEGMRKSHEELHEINQTYHFVMEILDVHRDHWKPFFPFHR